MRRLARWLRVLVALGRYILLGGTPPCLTCGKPIEKRFARMDGHGEEYGCPDGCDEKGGAS